MPGRLHDRVCLVFGAGTSMPGMGPGNGEATALTYAREGALLALVDLDANAAEQTARRVRDAGADAIALRADVSVHADVRAAVRATLERFGRIDVLHNNVGIEALGGVIETAEDDWDRVLDVNLKGVFLACKEVLPGMVERGRGAIVNVSSTASLRWGPAEYIAYQTSKAGLNHFSRIVARRYAPHGIRCNVIVPGMIDSPHVRALYRGASPEDLAGLLADRDRRCPMGRQGSCWDVANAALFLASDEAGYVSGALLPVDGALSV